MTLGNVVGMMSALQSIVSWVLSGGFVYLDFVLFGFIMFSYYYFLNNYFNLHYMYDKGHAAADLEDPLICFKVLKNLREQIWPLSEWNAEHQTIKTTECLNRFIPCLSLCLV